MMRDELERRCCTNFASYGDIELCTHPGAGRTTTRRAAALERWKDECIAAVVGSNGGFASFFREHATWSQATFGTEATEPVIQHVLKELQEILATPDRIEEWCDAIILLVNGARCQGFSADAVLHELWRKLAVNKVRTWVVTKDGTIEHVRETAETAT